MKKTLLMAVWVVTAAGCAGGKASSANQAMSNIVAPSAAPLGQFVVQKSDSAEVQQDLSCDGKNLGLDPRLNAGQRFFTRSVWLTQSGGYYDSGTVDSTISSVDFNQNLVKKNTTVQLGKLGVHHVRQACRFDNQVTCQQFGMTAETAARVSQNHAQNVPATNCSLTSDGKSDRHVYEVGTYAFAHRQSALPAVREEDDIQGTITCKKADGSTQTIGHGTHTTIRIASDQVPSADALSCGGASDIFVYDVIKADNGTILSLNKYEVANVRF